MEIRAQQPPRLQYLKAVLWKYIQIMNIWKMLIWKTFKTIHQKQIFLIKISPIKGLINKKCHHLLNSLYNKFPLLFRHLFVTLWVCLFSLRLVEDCRERGLLWSAPSLSGLGPFTSLNLCVISRCIKDKLQCWTARMTCFFRVCVCVCVHICRNTVWTPVPETQTSTGMKAMTRGEEKRGEPDHGPAKQNQILTA